MIKWNTNLLHNFFWKWMEIDERVSIEIDADLCCDNPDIVLETVLIFSKCSFCWFVMWEEVSQKMKIMSEDIDFVPTNVWKKKRVDEE